MRIILISVAATLLACGGGGTTNANPPPAGPSLTAIFDIQGSDTSSPLEGMDVTVEGIVTGDFQDGDGDTERNLGGFYIQSVPDGDMATSDGVFVFDGSSPATDVNSGDLVRVAGTVTEYFGETQVAASEVTVVGAGSIEPLPINLPVATTSNSDGDLIADLERFEGMLVRFPQTLTVSQLRNLERYGEILLSEGGRQYAFANLNLPDVAGYTAHVEAIAARRIVLDDGKRNNNPGGFFDIRNGDEIANVTGVLRFSRGSGASGEEIYRLMPTVDPDFEQANPRPGTPGVAGDLVVATFNVDNFFSTVDDDGPKCGPTGEDNCRGADSDEELHRQLQKIVTVLEMMNADVTAIVELENNATASVQTIVDALNSRIGSQVFAYVDAGTIGTDAIKVGFIYRTTTTQTVGGFAVLDSSVDVRFDDDRHRPVLAQTFETTTGSERFTVLALHLKSKGSSCESSGDPNVGDGQGNCSATRALAAAAIVDWIATDPTSSGDADFIVIGDFNTHTMGEALTLFESAGYINVADVHIGADAYSFEFDGQFGALDHAMASPSLAPKVVGATEWHINADEAGIHDYNLDFGRDPGLFDGTSPYRASDHDPLIISIEVPP